MCVYGLGPVQAEVAAKGSTEAVLQAPAHLAPAQSSAARRPPGVRPGRAGGAVGSVGVRGGAGAWRRVGSSQPAPERRTWPAAAQRAGRHRRRHEPRPPAGPAPPPAPPCPTQRRRRAAAHVEYDQAAGGGSRGRSPVGARCAWPRRARSPALWAAPRRCCPPGTASQTRRPAAAAACARATVRRRCPRRRRGRVTTGARAARGRTPGGRGWWGCRG